MLREVRLTTPLTEKEVREIKAGSEAVYSPLGSNPAVKTLRNYGIRYHFIQTVPYIQNRNQDDMCPMEKLSINKNPEEFYEAVKRYYD